MIEQKFPVNEEIREREVHLIMQDGRSAGTVSLDQARYLASQYDLDLVQINNQKPPVVKLLDYNKYRYQQEKNARTVKKTGQLKEMRLSFLIDEHDLATKATQARKFLADGSLVRLFILLRGRQNLFPDKGKAVLEKFRAAAGGEWEQNVTQVGKRLQAIIRAGKKSPNVQATAPQTEEN